MRGGSAQTAEPLDLRTGPRVLTLDIETAPILSYVWDLWDQTVGLEQIETEWAIIAYSAKWLGKKKLLYRDTGRRGPSKVLDDKALVNELWTLLNAADVVIAQNGKAFDLKKINARLLEHGHKPYSPVKIVDTMLAAKRHFAFTSNKLQWLSAHLTPVKKSIHKKFPGFLLWKACLKDDPKAWAEMRKYNMRDVLATEQLYLKLRPWIEGHPNVANYSASEDPACPKCGSEEVQRRGRALTQSGEYHRLQCMKCGGWARSRYTMNTIEKRHALLSN